MTAKALSADVPPEGIPGEDDDILIELRAEIYGLASGPPAWRQSLFTTFKQVGFKAHPLAPCVVIFYEMLSGKPDQFRGLICVETDDLLGGGIGPKFQAAVDKLRSMYSCTTAGRAVSQHRAPFRLPTAVTGCAVYSCMKTNCNVQEQTREGLSWPSTAAGQQGLS